MDQPCPQKSFLLSFMLFCASFSWLHVIFILILHSHHKIVAGLSNWCPERHILDATTFIWYVIIDGPYCCPFHAVGLTYFANIPFHHFHLELSPPLAVLCLPPEVLSLQGHIYSPSSIMLCSHFFIFLRPVSRWRRFSWWLFCLWWTPLWLILIQALRCSKYSWLIKVRIGLQLTWPPLLLVVSYLLCLLYHTSSYDHFRLSHQYCILRYWSYFSLCMWNVMMHRCLLTILWGLLRCLFPSFLHKICLPQIYCWRHLISLYSLTNNQPPCGTFYHSCYIICSIRVFYY